MSSGLIYAVIVGAWAAVLIPMWLRRQDARAQQRAEEDSPLAVRVVSRGGEERRETSRRTRPDPVEDLPRLPRRPAGAWGGRRSLAARRRRLLGALMGVTVFATVGALLSVLSVRFLAGCLLLLSGYLVHLRLQARRDAALARRRRELRKRTEARMRRVDSAERVVETHLALDAERAALLQQEREREAAEGQAREAAEQEEQERRRLAELAAAGWEPRPTTLPTYVTAPTAPEAGSRPETAGDPLPGEQGEAAAPVPVERELEPRPRAVND